jgi:hypothetical protein
MRSRTGRALFALASVLTLAAALVGSVQLFTYGLFAVFVLGLARVFDYGLCPHCRTPRRRAANICWACGRDYAGSESLLRRSPRRHPLR